MEIWAHTLVKNEARWLWFSVNSVINFVDKILLWDTGSTDGSIEIAKELKKLYPEKIIFKERNISTSTDFTKVRQEMLDATESDWFLMVDADEIWWNNSIVSVVKTIETNPSLESVVVPTLNLVGDIFHFQDSSAGRYKFGSRVGHYNLRAINRSIPGLHSQGVHGVWGWSDFENKMIQDRNIDKIEFIDAPYLHATFVPRGRALKDDLNVIKRNKKYKYEFGQNFPKDFFYPEVLFKTKPEFIQSPWGISSFKFKTRAFVETPLRKIKRKIWIGRVGY
ncbi:MAG TPA: glycosyltransferase family 2 protein [Patescibacteria group bacterium]|nr:glycosyltransferase family 2 protein [Patescibacteria group bacterium]